MPRTDFLLIGLHFLALPAGPLSAQAAPENPPALFTLNVRTALEEVVVLDKKGSAVPGLRREDFQVFENGKPQAITFFEPSFGATDTVTRPAALPPNTFTNNPLAASQNVTNVLLLDALNSWPEDRMYAHVQMVKYLASLPPNLRIGIFTLTDKLNLIQGFNQDSSELRASINQFISKQSSSSKAPVAAQQRALMTAVDEVRHSAQARKDARLMESADALQRFLKNGTGILYTHNQLQITMNALRTLAQYLGGIPGRKNLFWLIGNFPHCDLGCPYVDFVQKTKDILAEAGVSVYPIDAGGVNVDMGIGPSAFQHQVSTRFNSSEIWAEETGGKAYHANDIQQEIADAVEHGSHYYTLAYVPADHEEEGRERKVQIKVAGNYTLFYRQRYFEPTRKDVETANAAPARNRLISLMGRGLPNIAEIPYLLTIEAAPVQAGSSARFAGQNTHLTGKLTRYSVNFQIKADALPLPPDADGIRRKTLQIALMVYSEDGKPLNWEIREIHLQIRPEQWPLDQKAGIRFHTEIDAPSGDIYLRTGVYDRSSNKIGTLEFPLSSIIPARE